MQRVWLGSEQQRRAIVSVFLGRVGIVVRNISRVDLVRLSEELLWLVKLSGINCGDPVHLVELTGMSCDL